MALVEFNWKPTRRQLHQFALICCIALPVLGWLWGAGTFAITLLVLIGLALAIVGMLRPRWIKPLFVGAMLVGTPIGVAVGEATLLLVYVLVFCPIGLALRLLRRDPLQHTVDRGVQTYWQLKKPPRDAASYYRQS